MANPVLDNTKEMLDILGETQLEAVNAVVRAFVLDGPFRAKTEDELFERIDRSLAEADAGKLQDADEALDEVMGEIGI